MFPSVGLFVSIFLFVPHKKDFLFNLEYIRYTRLVAAVSKPLYCYVKREGSLVASNATLRNSLEMKLSTFACYKDLYQALDLYDEQKPKVYKYLISAATDGGAGLSPELNELGERIQAQLDQWRQHQQLRRLTLPRSKQPRQKPSRRPTVRPLG